ncbi:SDR family oxidoreductase [Tenggerimyces flavus]|uniref:SDR family oxidoreductase n=1 Tax=Tenggerimyces flavus TaxID=1708749 RepID=A0ABV7YHR4_9ACTN|nr:SDR family oxidoreductase [Tenggerimyces flavus]MBM7787659.1 NAD(P)H dehydrogenase (quinone) [Tenggerimyces flavus]
MIVVTGATGGLGRLVVQDLLAKVPASQIRGAVRTPENAKDLADLGVDVRKADYDQPETLAQALESADKVLLISASEPGKRVPQHQAVVDAAAKANVRHLAYTSAPRADTSKLFVAPDHKATEELIRASGLPFTFLRNGWYHENYAQVVANVTATGVLHGSAHRGKVASAARADYAAAAAEVLTTEGHHGKTYELSGDAAWTYEDLAEAIGREAGRQTRYEDHSREDHAKVLADAGVPEAVVGYLLTADQAVADHLLGDTSGDLRALIGRPTTPLAAYVKEVLATRG